jgi:hypothetical protein
VLSLITAAIFLLPHKRTIERGREGVEHCNKILLEENPPFLASGLVGFATHK